MVTIDNRKKQQDFFLKEIDLINEAIKNTTYDIGENTSASMNKTLTSSQIFDEDDSDDSADFEMSSPPVEEQKPAAKATAKSPVAALDDDDEYELPF